MGTSAYAHPKLKSAVPPVEEPGAPSKETSAAPKEIRLLFSEAVIAKMSGIVLKDGAGKPVQTGSPATDPQDQKQLIVPVSAPLAPGRYNVSWHAVSDDTHRVKGEYSFIVGR